MSLSNPEAIQFQDPKFPGFIDKFPNTVYYSLIPYSMSFSEKQLTSLFSSFLKSHPIPETFAVEFKVVKGNTLNLSHDMQPQQIPCLIKARYNTLYHKISDFSPSLKPFDAFHLHNTAAYLAILFYKPKQPKLLHFIPINLVLFLQLHFNRISATQAQQFATYSFNL